MIIGVLSDTLTLLLTHDSFGVRMIMSITQDSKSHNHGTHIPELELIKVGAKFVSGAGSLLLGVSSQGEELEMRC
jgi:hypothetical protein